MESAIPLLLFLGLMTGATLLILICGCLNQQEETAGDEQAAGGGLDLVEVPRFFARLEPQASPTAGPVDRELVERVVQYLHEEQILAAEFVDQPSVERLHGPAKWELVPDDSLRARVERHIRREQAQVREFISNPSVERLYGKARPLVAVG